MMLPKYVVCEEHHHDNERYAFAVVYLFKNIDLIGISKVYIYIYNTSLPIYVEGDC